MARRVNGRLDLQRRYGTTLVGVAAVLALRSGHATLIKAEAEARARVPVFQPLSPGVAALSARVLVLASPPTTTNGPHAFAAWPKELPGRRG